jgi:hypothetical protein
MNDDSRKALWAEIRDMLRLTASHYGLWFAETERVMGLEAAIGCEAVAGERFMRIAGHRLDKAFCSFELSAENAADMPASYLDGLADTLAVNWLAADGVWFQAVENASGMDDAKLVNDTCWRKFAPLEARCVMQRLGIPEGGGIDALEAALSGRMYARINEWKAVRDSEHALVFTMLRCRVQDARTRKGLPEYPCKSGGKTEYTAFAQTIDPRIETRCIGCPPDERDEGYACSWRFTMETAQGSTG